MKSALSNPTKQKKIATLITKHESEWVKSMDRWKYVEKYIPDATRYDWEHEKAKIQKLAWWDDVKGKVTGFPSGDAYYFHPAGFVGNFVGGGFDWSQTPLIKLIISKESKGSYSAYNITGWTASGKNKIYESHFKAEGKYLIETMTITQIKAAQALRDGVNKKHLFAIGLYQVIPMTLSSFLPWINKYKAIDDSKLKER